MALICGSFLYLIWKPYISHDMRKPSNLDSRLRLLAVEGIYLAAR